MNIMPAIERLRPWLESEEMALIGLNGGFELTIRDRLLLPLQQEYQNLRVCSEFQRADIAFLEANEPVFIAELKHNFISQKEWTTRLQFDIEKQKHRACTCQFVQIITTINQGPTDRKYRGESKHNQNTFEHFTKLQIKTDPNQNLQHETFLATIDAPYRISCRFDVYVITRKAT